MLRGPYLYAEPHRLLNPVSAQVRKDDKCRLSPRTFKVYERIWRELQIRYPEHRVTDFTSEDLDRVFTHAVVRTGHAGSVRIERDDNGVVRLTPRPEVGAKGWTEGTLTQNLNAIVFIFTWAFEHRLIEENPALRLRADWSVRLQTHRRHVWLNEPQVNALTDLSLAGEDPIALRDLMVCQFLVGSGVRAFEATAATWGDVEDGILHVNRGKGNKYRQVPLTRRTVERLDIWREALTALFGTVTDADPILPGTGHHFLVPKKVDTMVRYLVLTKPISIEMLRRTVTAAGVRIGEPRLRPHDLRRTYAGLCENAGIPIRTISKNLGHASVATTETYLGDNPAKRKGQIDGLDF